MDARQVILSTKTMSQMVLTKYISDLTDADLMLRPGKGCNHLAWQLGHLIKSECELLNSLVPGSAPALPAGFAEKHEKAKAGSDNASDFCTKAEYLDLIKQMNDAFTTTIKAVTDTDLDQPAPENLRAWFPTAGQVWLLVATHQLMQCRTVRASATSTRQTSAHLTFFFQSYTRKGWPSGPSMITRR